MGHHDHLWRQLRRAEELLEGLQEAVKRHPKRYGVEYQLKEIERLKKYINEINEELNSLGDFKYN